MQFQLSDVSGYYLLQPLTVLLEDLDYANLEIPHFHSPVFLENSYSAAAILLAVTMVESFTASVQYLLNSSGLPVVPFVQNGTDLSDGISRKPVLLLRFDTIVVDLLLREIS